MTTAPDTQLLQSEKRAKRNSAAADFTPANRMASQENSPNLGPNPARQLDFYQAMRDFQIMFPNMDEDVIEAVLRANNGAVDATIDQLLAMNVDTEAEKPTMKKQDEAIYVNEGIIPDMLDSSTSSEEELPPYAPPSYDDAQRQRQLGLQRDSALSSRRIQPDFLDMSPAQNHSAHNQDLDLLSDFLPSGGATSSMNSETVVKSASLLDDDLDSPPPPPPPPQMALLQHDYTPRQQAATQRRKAYKHWNPPLLGPLPDDFLRISISEPQFNQAPAYGEYRHSISPSLPRVGSCKERGQGQRSHHHRHHRRSGQNSSNSGRLNSSLLQQKMAENELKRAQVAEEDVEMVQVLEDEKLALMLQNQEFLMELRRDEDFMRTLERDRMNATAFEFPDTPPMPLPTPMPVPVPVPAPESPVERRGSFGPDRPAEDQMEGYGKDKQETLGAFPFSQQMPANDDAEFRRQLKHMGGSSRRKFAQAAKRFFSRKKRKSSRQILKESSAPSTVNLLEEDDDGEVYLNNRMRTLDRDTSSDTLVDNLGTVPAYRTVQRPPYQPDTVVTYHTEDTVDRV